MKVTKTNISDLVVIEPKIHGDNRGYFLEVFHHNRYKELANIDIDFVQDNCSRSSKNILRGLHFQRNYPQGKLVRVVNGQVFDVAVDLRKDSRTFGEFFSIILCSDKKNQLYIPPGFAHGFQVISEYADLEYKCTDYYKSDDEAAILWNDPELNIKWPSKQPILSKRDINAKLFKEHFF